MVDFGKYFEWQPAKLEALKTGETAFIAWIRGSGFAGGIAIGAWRLQPVGGTGDPTFGTHFVKADYGQWYGAAAAVACVFEQLPERSKIQILCKDEVLQSKVYTATKNQDKKGVLNENGKTVAGLEIFSYMIELYRAKEIEITAGLRNSRHPNDSDVYSDLEKRSKRARDLQQARTA